jgi:hypothetical protein
MKLLILTGLTDPIFTRKPVHMKFAIPTNDGINVASDFTSAKGCLIVTLVLGEIVKEDLRWRDPSSGLDTHQICSAVEDCTLVIIRDPDPGTRKMFDERNMTVIATKDGIITNAIVHYLEHEHLEASNTCCCP